VWLCDKYGGKIDYVYSNSHGMVTFEVFNGEYTIVAEGIEGYITVCPTGYPRCYGTTPLEMVTVYNMAEIKMYDKSCYKTVNVTVLDAKTDTPLSSAWVYSKDFGAYTDGDGRVLLVLRKDEDYPSYIRIDVEGYANYNEKFDALPDELVIKLAPLA